MIVEESVRDLFCDNVLNRQRRQDSWYEGRNLNPGCRKNVAGVLRIKGGWN